MDEDNIKKAEKYKCILDLFTIFFRLLLLAENGL